MSWDEWHPNAETLVVIGQRVRDGLAFTSLAALLFLGSRSVGRLAVAGVTRLWGRP